MKSSKPNILCFVTDQHRADHLGCYGNPDVRTPNIDRLAREGVLFAESYVANPVCMPNRASMFTGRYPKAHGVRENGITLSPDAVVLPEVLRQAGYKTASFGKIHLAPFGLKEEQAETPNELYETWGFWNQEKKLPLPYYGLEEVYYVGGHGSWTFGDYKNDLEREHPGVFDLWQQKRALEPPTGARESWKAAIPAEHHYNTVIADKTTEYLENHDGEKPFFVWCSFPDPHHPYCPPAPYNRQYDPEAITFDPARRADELDDLPPFYKECRAGLLPVGGLQGDLRDTTDAHFREIRAHTYGMISMVDDNIGRVMATLEDQGLLDNTIVVFFSDHGDLMGDHWLLNKGPFPFRGLYRVPTIWRLPDQPAPGRVSDALVSTVDLCPTLLDLVGVPIPDGVQGHSCKGILTGAEKKVREWAYVEYDETYIKDRIRQIRNHEWALTYYPVNDFGLMFDLKNDPRELYNLWDRPEFLGKRRELMAELLRHTALTEDWLPPKKVHA